MSSLFWKRWEYQTIWPASWETCMQVRNQQLELDMEQQTGFNSFIWLFIYSSNIHLCYFTGPGAILSYREIENKTPKTHPRAYILVGGKKH